MIPMSFSEADQEAYGHRMANNYVQAIKTAGVKRVVVLSGWAADVLSEGNAEQVFDHLNDVTVCVLI